MKLKVGSNYKDEDIKIARFAKALGHPARIAILRHLASLDTCRFTDISNELSLANSTVYQHLAELKRAGLIQGCIDPPKLQYCINYENWKLLRKSFKDFAEIEIIKYEKVNTPIHNEKWFNTGFFSHGVHNLTPGESYELCERGALIVDVREDYLNAFKMFRVERVLYLPYSHLEEHYKELPTDTPLIFADAVGLRSREAVVFMNAHGFKNVANMVGGIVDWERDGFPINTDINYRLSGSCMCQLKAREKSNDKP